ncbi:MAG: hypothetical protein U0401_34795 [Anaerolineae bacterium]
MSLEHLKLTVIIIIITLISGLADAQGAVHAAKIWQKGELIWSELGKSALGFGIGIVMYWVVLKYMTSIGIVAPEIQVITWLGVMLVGVALISGAFFKWQLVEQAVAIGLMVGLTWLMVRTAG